MSVLVSVLLAVQVITGATTISGQVVDGNGSPIVHAQVFLEPGLGGVVLDAVSDEAGQFQFERVDPGPAGLFAVAPGFGFEGEHVNVAVSDVIPPIRLTLHPATQVTGTISSHDGKALSGARITRIGIKGVNKVGVPLAKLRHYGYIEPQSDENGHFILENVPQGCTVDLKVGHPQYAQEGVGDVAAGTSDVRISLYPGVLVEGLVVSRANQNPVAQVSVLIQNAQPPHDTAVARSSLQGKFSLRLKPGVYLYQATGAGMRSPGWERLTITGEKSIENVRLAVAGTGEIRGSVRDAISSAPIQHVRVSLITNGTRAAVMRTGPEGDFLFSAGEGENIIRIDVAPGYFPPESQDIKVSILEGMDVELPGMWLKPLPTYSITVVDEGGAAVPGALVSVLRPAQFGWHVADSEGRVGLHIQSFPEGGSLLGRVEHPTLAHGALFSLEKEQTNTGTVQLYPTATVTGTVVNGRGRGVGGALVGAFFPGETATDAVLLWSTVSDDGGAFTWNGVVPGVPQRCVARLGDDVNGESMTFNLAPAENKLLGNLVIEGGKSSESLIGKTFDWKSLVLVCGTVPMEGDRVKQPSLVLYCSAASVPAMTESAAQIRAIVANEDLIIAVVGEGNVDCDDSAPVPVFSGRPVSAATTLLVSASGTVLLESRGLPPIAQLRALRAMQENS